MKKVSAATVTRLSLRAAAGVGSSAPLPPQPTREQLLKDLHDRVGDPARVESFLADLPHGFEIVPVLYTRIHQQQNSMVEAEYSLSVRADFLRFLGETQKGPLRALGFCEHAIARLCRGLDPATKDGDYYQVSVDHIIERAGGGVFSQERAIDPQRQKRRKDERQTYQVNHFANMILLPDDVHDYKNRLAAMQGINGVPIGESRWLLMMVPVNEGQTHGYVSPPPRAGQKLGRLVHRRGYSGQRWGEMLSLAKEARQTATEIEARFQLSKAVQVMEKIAQALHPASPANDVSAVGRHRLYRQRVSDVLTRPVSVVDVALTARSSAVKYRAQHQRLMTIFNTAASNQQVDKALRQTLTRQIDHVRSMLVACYHESTQGLGTRRGRERYKQFRATFEGATFQSFCYHMSCYPLPGSLALLAEYRRIAADIRRRDAQDKKTTLTLPKKKTA